MAELYVVGRGNPGLGRLGNGATVEDTVDAHYALVDFARASAQVHQFVDGRCYARPHDDEEQPDGRQRDVARRSAHQQDADREEEGYQ